MNPGRELDALVAEKVMGCKPKLFRHRKDIECGCEPMNSGHEKMVDGWSVIPHYSTDIAAAWDVVEHMKNKEDVYQVRIESNKRGWEVRVWMDSGDFHYGEAETLPYVVCLAALDLMGVEI